MAQKIRKTLILIILTVQLVSTATGAATLEDMEKFPAVSGEIFGQAIRGVKSITINKKPVQLDANQNFRAAVDLKAGEKYLTLQINYEGLRIIKKYLILRKKEAKTFKVFVPKDKFAETVQESKQTLSSSVKAYPKKTSRVPARKPQPVAQRKPPTKKPATSQTRPPKQAEKTLEYHYVWEFSSGKLLVVKEKQGSYEADIYLTNEKKWLDLKGVSDQDLQELIGKSLIQKEGKP